MLDKDLQPDTNDLSDFIQAADWCAEGQKIRKLKATIKRAYQWYKETPSAREYSCEGGVAWYRDLDGRINEGWTKNGQTNEILKDLANFGWVFMAKKTVEELADYMHKRAITLPGYKDWCGHQRQIKRRCHDWAKSAVNYWSHYPSNPKRSITYEQLYEQATNPERPTAQNTREQTSHQPTNRRSRQQINKERRQDSMERLRQVIARIDQLKTLPQKIGELIELICQTSKELFNNKGFSRKTLQNALYLPLWHPKHRKEQPRSQQVDIPKPASKKSDLSPINTEVNNQPTKSPETLPHKEQPERSHSPQKSEKIERKTETPETAPQKDSSEKDPTITKCFVSPLPQGLDLLSEEEKMELVEGMIDRQYRFNWHQTSGMVQLTNDNKSQLCKIDRDTIVTVLDSYHSSVLGDGKRSLLVYVKPIKAVQQWQSGIAVPINHLELIESKLDLSTTSNVYRE